MTSVPSRFLAVYLFAAAVLVALIAALLVLNGGTFSYTLDDAYIHLAVSESIRAGGYGVNPGEYASPSSSILFPLLLAPAALTPFHQYAPFVLSLAALAATIDVLRRFARRIGFDRDRRAMRAGAMLVAAFILSFNLIGLTLSGLEHSIHVALTCAIVFGLIVFLEEDRLPGWFLPCLFAAPLFRYEAVALSLTVAMVIAARGRWKAAALVVGGIAASLGIFSWFLVSHAQSALPASILVKTSLSGVSVEDHGLRAALAPFKRNLQVNLLSLHGALLAVAGAVGAAVFVRGARRCEWGANTIVAGVLAAFVMAHLLCGKFGWFARYEIYAMAGAAMMLVYLAGPRVRAALAAGGARRVTMIGCAGLLTVGSSYVYATLQVPIASNNMFEQQYQMHRFLTEVYRKPVAVNDLGWTSFRNDAYVFDLWGLGSEESRRTAMNDDLEVMNRLVQERGVALAIIYPDWFKVIPETWVPLAEMEITRTRVTAGRAAIRFYATRADAAVAIRADLQAFARTLPPRLRLDFIAPPAESAR